VLTVSGEKRIDRQFGQGLWRIVQSAYGSFHRDVALPAEVQADKTTASYRDGVLRIELPKSDEARARRTDRRALMMSSNSLARKKHPANLVFFGSTLSNEYGENFIDVFNVFVNHGLTPTLVDEIAHRNYSSLDRACKLANVQFLTAIIPCMTCLPTRLEKSIVASPDHAEKLIALLTTKCGVSLRTFTDPAVLMAAEPNVASYIEALEARDMPIRAPSEFSF